MYTHYPYINNNGTITNSGEADAFNVAFSETTPIVNNTGRMLPAAEGEERHREGKRSWHPDPGVLVEL